LTLSEPRLGTFTRVMLIGGAVIAGISASMFVKTFIGTMLPDEQAHAIGAFVEGFILWGTVLMIVPRVSPRPVVTLLVAGIIALAGAVAGWAAEVFLFS
jgi:hypothetical protein